MTRPNYPRMPGELRQNVQRLLVYVLASQDKCEEGLPLAIAVSQTQEAVAFDWAARVRTSIACGNPSDAAAALTVLAVQYPEYFKGIDDGAVLSAARWSEDPLLLSFLANGGWQPQNETTNLSTVRLSLARAYARAGDHARAAETAQALITNGDSLGEIIVLLAGKSFEPIIAQDPETFDFDSILAWRMQEARASVQNNPRSLDATLALARALMVRNQLQEAHDMVAGALARVESAPAGAPPFDDLDDSLNWAHNLRSDIQDAMGDDEAAVAALEAGAGALEHGARNVSQTLNLGAMLVRVGRGAQALEAVADFNPSRASPYGVMVWRGVRVCAHAQLGQDPEMRAALEEMRVHRADSPAGLFEAALCANDMDLAADAYLSQLSDVSQRDFAILFLQRFAGDEDGLTDHERQQRARREAVFARPDVAAAIARACIRRRFPIRSPL